MIQRLRRRAAGASAAASAPTAATAPTSTAGGTGGNAWGPRQAAATDDASGLQTGGRRTTHGLRNPHGNVGGRVGTTGTTANAGRATGIRFADRRAAVGFDDGEDESSDRNDDMVVDNVRQAGSAAAADDVQREHDIHPADVTHPDNLVFHQGARRRTTEGLLATLKRTTVSSADDSAQPRPWDGRASDATPRNTQREPGWKSGSSQPWNFRRKQVAVTDAEVKAQGEAAAARVNAAAGGAADAFRTGRTGIPTGRKQLPPAGPSLSTGTYTAAGSASDPLVDAVIHLVEDTGALAEIAALVAEIANAGNSSSSGSNPSSRAHIGKHAAVDASAVINSPALFAKKKATLKSVYNTLLQNVCGLASKPENSFILSGSELSSQRTHMPKSPILPTSVDDFLGPAGARRTSNAYRGAAREQRDSDVYEERSFSSVDGDKRGSYEARRTQYLRGNRRSGGIGAAHNNVSFDSSNGTGDGDSGTGALSDGESAESAVDRMARLATETALVANELRTQAQSLPAEDVDAVAAMLVSMAERSATTIAAMTVVYNIQSRSRGTTAKGEAAIVWRSDSRMEKTIKQFIRVYDKVSQGSSVPTGFLSEQSNIEIVANSYEISTGYKNARYTLAVLLLLLSVVLRTGRRNRRSVWLQPVDIHEPTPASCVREWNPSKDMVILSVKGPWPWGDQVRAAVSVHEREELALTLAEGQADVPIIGRLEEQASELLEQKREKHVFLLGTTGVGKSSLGNLLVGQEVFHVDPTKTGTMFPQPQLTSWGSERQIVWDSPGLNDAKNRDPLFLKELALVVDRVQLASAVVLVIRSPARVPHSLIVALEKYIDLFGPQLSSVLFIVVNEASRVFSAQEIEMYSTTVAEQLADELGLQMEPGFLLQIPTGDFPLAPEVGEIQKYNLDWMKQAVLQSRPVLTRMGFQTIESLLALRTTLDAGERQHYQRQLLEQSGRQREGMQMLLSRADVRKAYFSKRGYILIQTWDLSRANRVLQVLQQQDSRMQQRREIRITPDNPTLGNEVAHSLRLRKKHYTSRKEVRATTPEDVFSVLEDLDLVLIPLTVPSVAHEETSGNSGETYAAARPGDRVSQRTLKAIADVLTDTNTAESVVRLVQSLMEESTASG